MWQEILLMSDCHLHVTGYGNCEEELPEKPVGRLSVDCRPSDYRQVTNKLPTATDSRPAGFMGALLHNITQATPVFSVTIHVVANLNTACRGLLSCYV